MQRKVLFIGTFLTSFIVLYTAFFYIDQSYQSKVMIHKEDFATIEKNPSIKKLGFSDVVISHMSDSEINKYKEIKANLVFENTLYRKIMNTNVENITQDLYVKTLIKFANSKMPRSTSLERVNLKLLHEGNNQYMMITEHHFEYLPRDLKPMMIEIQLRDEFIVHDQEAKQIWYSNPSYLKGEVKSGTIPHDISYIRPDQQSFFFEESTGSGYYTVDWKQPGLFEDIIGAHFYTITRFEVPKDSLIIDAYIQGQNPNLSEQLFYDTGMN